ncbi:MAG: hypothetical protein EP339_00015 [Gammaproteobacteria bacterium]|nr:MAG: hypothetical protein EP339_00015 [Gammaproteobacteria bacterium]
MTTKIRLCLVLILLLTPEAKAAEGGDMPALARFALASGQPDAALYWASRSERAAATRLVAETLLRLGDPSGAVAVLTDKDNTRTAGSGNHESATTSLMLATLLPEKTVEVRQHLVTAASLGSGETQQQALYRLAEHERIAGQTDQAGAVLSRMTGGYWSALGYLNLAADYSREDRDPTRALVSLRVALALAAEGAGEERVRELVPRILLRAGYLSYQSGDYEKAVSFLSKVPLDSYVTPRALYLHGLSHAARKNYRAAIQSWHRATKYPMAYPGVADAWMGMAGGYDLSGYLGQAGEYYLAANAAFDSERVTLRTLAGEIQNKGAYSALVIAARQTNVEWFLADSRNLVQPRMAYLLRFLEDSEAQQAVQRVARLANLADLLAQYTKDLELRKAALTQNRSVGMEQLRNEQKKLLNRYNRLANQFGVLEAGSPIAGRPSALGTLRVTLNDLAGSIQNLTVRAQAQAKLSRSAQAEVDEALSRATDLRQRIPSLDRKAREELDRLALVFIGSEEQRMVYALNRTEQQIAHLYEHLAVRSIERSNP